MCIRYVTNETTNGNTNDTEFKEAEPDVAIDAEPYINDMAVRNSLWNGCTFRFK